MQTNITIRNYRCFTKSATFTIGKGFTAFLGINNAGKSTLMKFFLEFRNLFQLVGGNGNFIRSLKGGERLNLQQVSDLEEVFSNINTKEGITITIDFIDNIGKDPEIAIEKVIFNINRQLNWETSIYTKRGLVQSDGHNYQVQGSLLMKAGGIVADLKQLFTVCRTLSNSLYIGPFRNILNTGTKKDYYDIQVGQAFIQQLKQRKSGNIKKENKAIIRLTDDIRKIFEFDYLEINPSPDETTLQVITNKDSYRLDELGAGLAQFILVLANAAVRKPAFILIDEPELNLHPSLQLDFLTTLGSYASEGVMFATHTIGLARSAADRIYSVRKENYNSSVVSDFETTPTLAELVGELSFAGQKELGFEKILMIEGKTDIKTIQQFLRTLRKDHRILLLPLGGDNLINGTSDLELNEVKRITPKVYALIDNEKEAKDDPLPPKREAFRKSCSKLGINLHILDSRATENYLTERAIKRVKGNNYSALAPYQKLKDIDPRWLKTENWRIAREMNKPELEGTDLGKFLIDL